MTGWQATSRIEVEPRLDPVGFREQRGYDENRLGRCLQLRPP